MNAQDSPAGKAPPLGDQIDTDHQTYFHWLSKGAPTDTKLKGAGFIKLKETKLGYDPGRGAQVFQQNCASCHGADGQGQREINGRVVFPPLWGRSEEHTSELQSLIRISYADFSLKKNNTH